MSDESSRKPRHTRLGNRVVSEIPHAAVEGVQAVEGIERSEVQKPPRGVAPDELVWQGGATLPALGGASKLWILQQEWERRGAQAARDVCPFAW